jgi:XRE family aerobic/anaerobic benzoate catabolism transcriptional regulator
MTRQDVADASGVSLRFLGSLELGEGNISMIRLAEVAEALEVPLSELFEFDAGPNHKDVIALLGLRGAGKSTLGPALAKRLAVSWIELDERIEQEAGLSLAEIFALHGEAYYRRLERQTIEEILDTGQPAVIETGGGIVTAEDTYALLRHQCTTVWLRALPSDHMARVQAQGDHRPMAGRPNAMRELEELLETRRPLYSQAEITINTSRGSPEEAIDALVAAVQGER